MKKIRNIVLGGIQQKVFNLVLVTVILMAAGFMAVSVHQTSRLTRLVSETNEKQEQSIAQISRETMDGVLSSSLTKSSQMQAYIADEVFQELRNEVQLVGDMCQELLENPGRYPRKNVELPELQANGTATLQLLAARKADLMDPETADKIALIGNLGDLMLSLFERTRINSCFIGLPEGAFVIADDRSGAKFSQRGSIYPYPVTERFWYTGAVEAGGLYFTDVEADAFTGVKGIVCSLPVYVDGKLEAVVGADLFLDSMEEAVNASEENGSFVCIVNNDGHVLFSPRSEGIFQVNISSRAEDLRESDNEELADFIRDALEGNTDVRLIDTPQGSFYLCGAPLSTVGWAVVSVVSKEATDQPTVRMEEQYETIEQEAVTSFRDGLGHARRILLLVVLVILALGISAALTVSKRIVDPLNTFTSRVASLGGKNIQFRMEDVYRTDDEIEVLAESFANLSARTVQYIDQIRQVTAEKERIGAELDMATKIQASQVPRLFPAFPNRPEFDLYASMTPAKEVGGDFYDFFLTDDDHICLVMADVSGKGVPAALFMMVSRVLIKTHIQNGETPAQALASVNDQLCESNEADFFVTVWLAVIQISTGKGIAANAGHEHPVLRRAGGSYELVTYRHSPAVAVMEGIPFREHTFELYPGDSLFVYTDGVAEATDENSELFGTGRMLDALNQNPDASPEDTLDHVIDAIHSFVGKAEQFDDITMMCMKYIGPE